MNNVNLLAKKHQRLADFAAWEALQPAWLCSLRGRPCSLASFAAWEALQPGKIMRPTVTILQTRPLCFVKVQDK